MSKKKSRKRVPEAVQPSEPISKGGSKTRNYSLLAIVCVSVISVLLYAVYELSRPKRGIRPLERARGETAQKETSVPRATPRFYDFSNLFLKWDDLGENSMKKLKVTSNKSNIRPQDYAGPESCADCHQENFADWSNHSHRWMNALATEENVQGDFSGEAKIQYHGGTGTFFRKGNEFRMRYERDDLVREYRITQTIGSRFYQYFVGVGLEGPEPKEHDYYTADFVLPFGYWLDRKAWVPVVHIFTEAHESVRWDSLEQLKPPASARDDVEEVGAARGVIDHTQDIAVTYARSCNFCHTTFALGDMMIRNPKVIGPSLPEKYMLELDQYVSAVRPKIWDGKQAPEELPLDGLKSLIEDHFSMDAREHAVTLGVSCEACHLGCEEHTENEKSKPAFTGQNPHLFVDNSSELNTGRSPANLNAACARCHAGNRPTYAAGMSTWNSTEYSDAIKGSCYSQLTCVNCHDPHKSIGKQWTETPTQDDASCLSCHNEYRDATARSRHTHHPAGSSGDRCLNCHMPKINEGMQDVVRTHTIFSPTEPQMLAAKHPNACNLCHLEKNIEWTISYLQDWYGRRYDRQAILTGYENPTEPVGLGWLKGEHEATRLVATEAFAEQDAKWGLAAIVNQLDDPYLLNRQFAQKAVEKMAGVLLDKKFGFWYHMTAEEREPLLNVIRQELLRK